MAHQHLPDAARLVHGACGHFDRQGRVSKVRFFDAMRNKCIASVEFSWK